LPSNFSGALINRSCQKQRSTTLFIFAQLEACLGRSILFLFENDPRIIKIRAGIVSLEIGRKRP
jgi:hypothetical protein